MLNFSSDFIQNISEIINKIDNNSNVFYFSQPLFMIKKHKYVDTIFYKCTTNFFNKNLKHSLNECNYNEEGFLEAVYFKRLINLKKEKIKSSYPFYKGIAGTTGKKIINNKYLLRNFLSKTGFLCYELFND